MATAIIDPSVSNVWAPLLPVVVGGLIALAGSWLGPWLSQRQKEKMEEKTRRAEKFEELVKAIYELEHWLDMERNSSLVGDFTDRRLSPFAKIEAISTLYFSEFEEQVCDLDKALAAYIAWATTIGYKKVVGELSASETNLDGFDEVLDRYNQANGALLDALKDFAKREFQSKS
ncbi:MAG: hypothetical protein ABSC72_08050 [Methylovirgula sp.]|jgi:hypothetical protein